MQRSQAQAAKRTIRHPQGKRRPAAMRRRSEMINQQSPSAREWPLRHPKPSTSATPHQHRPRLRSSGCTSLASLCLLDERSGNVCLSGAACGWQSEARSCGYGRGLRRSAAPAAARPVGSRRASFVLASIRRIWPDVGAEKPSFKSEQAPSADLAPRCRGVPAQGCAGRSGRDVHRWRHQVERQATGGVVHERLNAEKDG